MIYSEKELGPSGNVKSEMFYKDSKGKAAPKGKATHCEIVVYDANGDEVRRVYGTVRR